MTDTTHTTHVSVDALKAVDGLVEIMGTATALDEIMGELIRWAPLKVLAAVDNINARIGA